MSSTIVETKMDIMGSTGHVMVLGGTPGLVDDVVRQLHDLEDKWTRFSPTSEISRINESEGTALQVSVETRSLVKRMIMAWELTAGRFDPTVASTMESIGYNRSFDLGLSRSGTLQPLPGDGCEGILVDQIAGTVQVPPSVRLDAGGIGKGFAADLVADNLIAQGAQGALVNVGGDLRVVGNGPEDGAWRLEIAEPAVANEAILEVVVPGGSAVATSTPLRRAWTVGAEKVHHLIDPVTGLPYRRVARLVSVVASQAWWAEVCTKQIAGLDPTEAERVLHEASALMIDTDGEMHLLRGMESYAA